MERSKTFVIADIGACHEGQLDLMFKSVEQAKSAGVDAIKFQWTSDPQQMAKRRGKAAADGYAAIYAKYLAWPREWLVELAAECDMYGIEFMCTVFLPEDVDVVAEHARYFKIASFEARDKEMRDAYIQRSVTDIESPGKMVIVSLGMGAEDQWHFYGYEVKFLHCVSSYPAPLEQMNLARLRGVEHVYSGLSDHSDPKMTWTGSLAVAAGATIVEAHLRLDETSLENPDGAHAMRTGQFREYVRNIRFAEKAMGDSASGPMPCERTMMQYVVQP